MERLEARKKTNQRDKGKCIICGAPVDEYHHLIERKLWSKEEDHGYIIDNLVSLCNFHHQQAENNILDPKYLRQLAGIKNRILPKGFDYDKHYDKWGNVLERPSYYNFKYPTTWYVAFSPSISNEDKRNVHHNLKHLVGVPVIIPIKMDGSNSRIDGDEKITARNGVCAEHESFDMMKSWFESELKWKMAKYKHLVIMGEWIYAKHSIKYKGNLALDSYFQCFSIYDRNTEMWLAWDEVEDICKKLDITMVPVFKKVTYDTEWELVADLAKIGEEVVKQGHEGIIIRSAYSFHFSKHKDYVLKYVRANHVQTDKHWMHQEIERNELKKQE